MVESSSRPQKVTVVGAGTVGLSAAWYLQEHGVDVTVVDSTGVAAGASWGNAGLLTTAFTVPMPSPGQLKAGPQALLDPTSAVTIPLRADRELWSFLMDFTKHSMPRRWRRAMSIFQEANRSSLETYDELVDGGVDLPMQQGVPLLAACGDRSGLRHLVDELEMVRGVGCEVKYDLVSGEELRSLEPMLSADVRMGALVHGQRFVHPPKLAQTLADAVRSRGGTVTEGFTVADVRDHVDGVDVVADNGEELRSDAVVLATGTWLPKLAKRFGVRVPMRPGRGYSFSVKPQSMPTHPVYLPAEHLACNALGDRFRVTGAMEFQRADAPFNPRRIHRMINAARPMFSGIDWNARFDEWVGSRPLTSDGLPLVGQTTSSRVHVSGGHGMWGIVFGPLTGKMLAESMVTGRRSSLMRFFDPLR
ncbi:FAD-binding oxidoreductase [Spiractinospora alimapuensis]|uniref:NAD(P)/FAD-dependent oxidoreductase n=1 Tax=Spiractinospora alimapuensis TaxID=2820884 RepID=UPI001F223768|nr:FAD-dependent oxidoreductase [Spiractinospora alimapuensis]QVQ50746.1 FAD-binding oxidoreductase [Spiractinospora alimapuensis]